MQMNGIDEVWAMGHIVNGTETAPPEREAAKFVTRRDCALALIVLSVEPSLLYLLGDPEDPVTVWKKLYLTSSRRKPGPTSWS